MIDKKEFFRPIGGVFSFLLLIAVFFFAAIITGCPEAQQVMTPVVSEPSDPAEEPMVPTEEPAAPPITTVGEEKQEPETPVETTEMPTEEPAEPVTEPAEEPVSTVTLPPGYELPPELIPTTPPTLSADEATMIEAEGWIQQNHPDLDMVTPKLRTQAGHPADSISVLPYKEREEVYELFVASVDLPSFAKAAQRLKEINIGLILHSAEAERTGNRDAYNIYREEVSVELGFLGSENLNTLSNIYFEENPEDNPYRHEGISYYWIVTEYYRLQLENPGIPNLAEKINPTALLNLFRQSCRNGYVFGLDNPWD